MSSQRVIVYAEDVGIKNLGIGIKIHAAIRRAAVVLDLELRQKKVYTTVVDQRSRRSFPR